MAVKQQDVWTRDYLRQRGVGNDQIGYSNGWVTIDGVQVFQPTRLQDNKSYGTKEDLDRAFNAYQQTQGQRKVSDTLGQIETKINTPFQPYQPAQPFSYDPQSDPQYQAALRRAQENARLASGNTMAQMNARGLLNSTITADRVGQIQQGEMARVSDELVPQLMQQAYQRYMDAENQRYRQYLDQYGMAQDQIGNLGNLVGLRSGYNQQLSAEDQRALDNAQRDWENRFAYGQAIGTFGNGQKTLEARDMEFSHQLALDQYNRGVFESDREFSENLRRFGLQYALDQKAFELSRQNSIADNNRQAAGQSFGQLMDIWRATGKAPAGIQGVTPGTQWYDEVAARQTLEPEQPTKIGAKESANNYNLIYEDLQTKGITKAEARRLLEQNADFLTDADYRSLNQWINDNILK